jgi:pyruvate/2-oxoglutarate dehydrogenase complex dihydrolipoamide dehydrogenase (E3) component
VAIIGAGPAGMRCAATAAMRGHEVDVYERAPETGGHLNLLRRMPTRENWGFLVEDLERSARDAGARLHLGTDIDRDALAALDADVVILATGSTWDDDGFTPAQPATLAIPGADAEDVIDIGTGAERALADPTALGKRVVIIDDTGRHLPIGLAEVLAGAGCEVTIVTRHLAVGDALLENYEANVVFPRVVAAGVRFRPQRTVTAIERGAVRLADIWGAEEESIDDVDCVVLSLLRTPVADLYEPARKQFGRVLRIGDALTPRTPSEVIFEAEKVARAL